jgi:hypothetical protein
VLNMPSSTTVRTCGLAVAALVVLAALAALAALTDR